jgi:hypothetical protein
MKLSSLGENAPNETQRIRRIRQMYNDWSDQNSYPIQIRINETKR